jgi:sugar-specific transcriptional regulator TrmB
VLVKLGLTSQQAKVYLALSMLQQASAKTISRTADIDRTEVYRAISGLQDIGVIEKIMAKPIEYKLISEEQGINFLIDRKKREVSNLEEKAQELLEVHSHKNPFESIQEDKLSYVVRSEAYFSKMKEVILNTNSTHDVLTTLNRSNEFDSLRKKLGIMYRKGVRVRLIVEVPDLKTEIPHKVLASEFRKTTERIAAPLSIHDKKQLIIFVSETTKWRDASLIHTNNPRMVNLAVQYFDKLWAEAQPIA